MRGELIVIEGPDSVGKSTLIQHMRRVLEQEQLPNEILSFPGDRAGTIGMLVYELHHAPEKFGIKHISPLGLQALHIAAHLDAITGTILQAIGSGQWVVLDRFWWSTWVYGRAAGIDPLVLDSLIHAEKVLWGTLTPSILFLIQRAKPFADNPQDDHFAALSDLYSKLSIFEAGKYEIVTIVDAEQDVAREIVARWVHERRT